LSYAFSLWLVYVCLRAVLPSGYLLSVGSCIVASGIFLSLWFGSSQFFFQRYKIAYTTCIRDSLFLILFTQVCAAFFVFVNVAVIVFAFAATYFISIFLYEKLLLGRKLPDVRIVLDLEADRVLDTSMITASDAQEIKKTRIKGEVRNSVVIKPGVPLILDVRGKKELHLGLGSKEFAQRPVRLEITGHSKQGEEFELFRKEFKPRLYFRDRVWNDTVIDLTRSESGQEIESVTFTLQAQAKSSLYASFPFVRTSAQATKKPNMYLIVVDSLRQDYFNCQTLPALRYPHIARFMEDSYVYENAYTQGGWTLPTLASLFSGLYASVHDQHHPKLQKKMNKEVSLLAEILRTQGYETFAYVTGPRTTPNYGFSRGFDRYYFDVCDKEFGAATIDSLFSWALEQDRKSCSYENQFYYLHLLEAHTPYFPPRDFEWKYNLVSQQEVLRKVKNYRTISGALDFSAQEMTFFKDLYRSELDYCFYKINQFFMYLKDRGVYDDALILIMGDHGCSFAEHGPVASIDIYREFAHVGLAIKYPQGLGLCGREERLVEASVGVMPTLLDILKVENPSLARSSFLREGKNCPRTERGPVAITEDIYVKRYSVALRDRRFSFIYRTQFDAKSFKNFAQNNEVFELYDRDLDPQEKENIYAEVDASLKTTFLALLNEHINSSLHQCGSEKKVSIGG